MNETLQSRAKVVSYNNNIVKKLYFYLF